MTAPVNHDGAFTGPEELHRFSAMLFDMGMSHKIAGTMEITTDSMTDGTLVDSTDAIIKHWHK